MLARLDDADLASTVDELEARAKFAQSQYERAQSLVRQGFMAKAETDRTRADLDAAEAAVKRARAQRDYMSLVAPADGLIIRRDGEIGQYIPAGQALFVLSCCAPLRVTAEVDEEDIARVRVGQKVVLRADALPGRLLDGTVSEITPKGDPVARSYRVRIKLANPDELKVGMTVDANLIVAERDNALLVPATALQSDAVWVVNDGRLHRQPVRVGVTGSGRVEILDGLAPDARVVDSPGPDLREGRARARPRSQSDSDEVMLALDVASAHLTTRKRQTLVSLSGVVLGVAFFLAVSSLMRGSEKDFVRRLVDNSPHITVYDEYRLPRVQPAALLWDNGAVQVSNVKPQTETRGIRGHRQKIEFVESLPGVRVAPVLVGSAVLTFAGRQEGVTLSGVVPATIKNVSTIDEKIIAGSLDALAANPNGIVIGKGLADKFNLGIGSTLGVAAPNGTSRPMKVVGIFRTGNASYDETQTFVLLKRAQVDARPGESRQPLHHPDGRSLRRARHGGAHREDDRLQGGLVGGGIRRHPERADHPQHHHVQRRVGDPDRRVVRDLQHAVDDRDGEDARHRDHEVDGVPRARHPVDLPARGADRRNGRKRVRPRARDGADEGPLRGLDQAAGRDGNDQPSGVVGPRAIRARRRVRARLVHRRRVSAGPARRPRAPGRHPARHHSGAAGSARREPRAQARGRSAGDADRRRQPRDRARPVHRDHGTVRLGKIVAALSAGPPRPADRGARLARRRGHVALWRGRAREPPAAQARLHLPVPFPARRVFGARQRHTADAPAGRARRRRRKRARHGVAAGSGHRRPGRQAAAPALRRAAPAGGDRPRARQRPPGDPRRRADRKSRFGVERQRPADPAQSRARGGHDDRGRHARRRLRLRRRSADRSRRREAQQLHGGRRSGCLR